MSLIKIPKTITKKGLIITTSVISAVIIGVFAYFYLIKETPVDTIKSIPIGGVTNPPEFSHHIFGSPEIPVRKILGMAAINNLVYATDTDAGLVHVFDKNGEFIRAFGQTGAVKLMHPYGLAEENGVVYVGDGGIGKILMYDLDGKYLGEFKTEKPVAIPSQMVISDGKLYYADLAMKKVFVYDLQGKLLQSFGEEGEGPGQFLFPHGLAVDKEGKVFVADSGTNRVLIFDKKGKFINYLLTDAKQPFDIGTPRNMGFDSRGNLYIAAGIENMVYTFDPDGKFLFTFNQLGEGITLGLPSGLVIDGNNVMVSETESSRIAVFKY